jgi:hypothetical protein
MLGDDVPILSDHDAVGIRMDIDRTTDQTVSPGISGCSALWAWLTHLSTSHALSSW